ncbi:MAG TPA: hypothetical protein VLT36_06800 [Candidatus Dormibacteraeota bacterium]|nr:hypothetical protein [Candidatus Dormibacteraeota bacterium]
MLRRLIWLAVFLCCAQFGARAATGRVIKVLPFFMDSQGRVALSPSLYERDAYQVILRDNPDKRSGMRFDIQWKAKGPIFEPLKLRAELKGVAQGNLPKQFVLETKAEPKGWFGNWTSLVLSGKDYLQLGEITSWRVTLWEGDELLGEEKSFLW